MVKFYSINKSDNKIQNKIIRSIKGVIKKNNFIQVRSKRVWEQI